MKKINDDNLTQITGGYCVFWMGPNQNASDNANPNPLPYQFCNQCLFLANISNNPNIVFCPL